MAKHHQLQPIANLRKRKTRWWREASDQFCYTLPVMAVALLIVSWILGQLTAQMSGQDGVAADALVFHLLNYTWIERAVLLLPIGLLLIIPMIFVSAGPYPSEKDVLRDQELRRSYGIPDAVAPEADA